MKVQILHKNGRKIVGLNRRKAIRFKCCDCSGWMLREVTNCSFTDCSLYPFRSDRGKQNAKDRKKAIKKYCMWCMCDQRSEIAKCTCPDCPIFPYRLSGGVDRSVEITSLPKTGHIEAFPKAKIKKPYLSMEMRNQGLNKTSLAGAEIGSGEKMLPPPSGSTGHSIIWGKNGRICMCR